MKRKLNKILAVTLAVAFLFTMGVGLALAEQQMQVNINKASVDELTTLKRIGPSYAQRIVDYRNEHGPFQKPEDIMQVKGIGMKTYEANKDVIVCE